MAYSPGEEPKDLRGAWRRSGTKNGAAPGTGWTLVFQVPQGGSLTIFPDEGEAEFSYAHGASRRVPLHDLRYCPECLRVGRFPFLEEPADCQDHDDCALDFDLADFERFQLVALLQRQRTP